MPNPSLLSRWLTLCLAILLAASGAWAQQTPSVYFVLSITPFSNGSYNISLMSVSTFNVHNATVTSQQLTGITTNIRVTETVSSSGVITLQVAPVGTPVTQLGQFQVQSITQNGTDTDDVKLFNPTTGNTHSVTCLYDVVQGISGGRLPGERIHRFQRRDAFLRIRGTRAAEGYRRWSSYWAIASAAAILTPRQRLENRSALPAATSSTGPTTTLRRDPIS